MSKVFKEKEVMGPITKEMGILDVVQQYPETIEVFGQLGFGCLGRNSGKKNRWKEKYGYYYGKLMGKEEQAEHYNYYVDDDE